MTIQQDDEHWLEQGWQWLEGHADHDPLPENYHWLEQEWLKRLRWYEEAYRLVTMDVGRPQRVVRAERTRAAARGASGDSSNADAQNRRVPQQTTF